MKKIISGLVLGCLAIMPPLAAMAADHKLIISSWASPQHGINAKMWPRFIEMIEEATDGRVTAELKLDLGPPPAQTDLIQDGIADVAIIAHSYQPGRFPSTKLAELPGYTASTEALSAAYWRAYDKYMKKANEHRGLKLLALHTNGAAQLHSNKKVTQLKQVEGMKLRSTGDAMARMLNELGASGIQVPAPKVYETLSSNAADGVLMPLEARVGFRLTEIAQNAYTMPGGFGRFSFAFVMNEDVFNALPIDIRQKLDEKVFGEPLSRELGRIWDEIDEVGIIGTLETEGNTINAANKSDQAEFVRKTAKVTQDIINEAKAKGINTEAVVEILKNAANEK
ncbi:TRAP transporter substrate-binding protein [Marinospirillum minutulum]|uniref:TRAP transporter substrate-binding protein n=1 Tax=Marinospirillum minutulum TaxID=64974 RepID=UPI000414CB64|nr:TRAP transporter substrate-binding protein [Marinospirillum minutulum]